MLKFVKKEFKFKFCKEIEIKLIKVEDVKDIPDFLSNQFGYTKVSTTYSGKGNKNNNKFSCEINIRGNSDEYFKMFPEYDKLTKNRFDKFLKNSVGVEINTEIHFLLILLHEFGHVDHLNKMYKYGHNMNTLLDLSGVYKHMTTLMFNLREMDEYFISKIENSFDVNEVYADKFVFENFIYIWNKVKHSIGNIEGVL